ncbi:uncharacterized protein I303_104562 [Kwoniella dejecticola CBS 10117]|uniref:Uncharacterized protein n=1 Tax=Kwoniella dejecticola CBS 10117 TaxID=1296121 RepID=A0A1A6A4Z4_9TREE|nr:uncharacterized protein I303_04461 [Kwoniella dejecticola CBS 10117]OBR85129.1 hypothetical protein I303_04461 [Kwoniella dejecticola CBS 10117]
MDPSELFNKLKTPTFRILDDLVKSKEIVFRIYTSGSTSPLIWTGSTKFSGFSSPNPNLASLTPRAYKHLFDYSNCHPLPPPDSGNGIGNGKGTEGGDDADVGHPRGDDGIDKDKGEKEDIWKWGDRGLKLVSSVTNEIHPGPYLTHTIVDHILNKSKQTCIMDLPTIEESPDGHWPDELTPWISTSENLFWVIWEIARRLSVEKNRLGWVEKVSLAVVRHPMSSTRRLSQHKSKADPRSESHSKAEGRAKASSTPPASDDRAIEVTTQNPIIDSKNESQENTKLQDRSSSVEVPERNAARGKEEAPFPPEIWLRPSSIRVPNAYPGQISVSLKEAYEASKKAAMASGEILFYGRIWAENVLCIVDWTRGTTPFELPLNLFVAKDDATSAQDRSHRSSRKLNGTKSRTRWIDELLWDPKTDEYLTALSKVKRHGMGFSR